MWLDRFERVGGKLMVMTVTKSGEQNAIPPEKMYKHRLTFPFPNHVVEKTSFQEWKKVSSAEYAGEFGFKPVSDHHDAFLIPVPSGRIIVSASRVQQALIGPQAPFVQQIYVPNGLLHICTPILDAGHLSIIPTSIPGLLDWAVKKTPLLLQRLGWFYAYPSAYRAWNSLYRHACAGRISIDLPLADLKIAAYGKYVDDTLYAYRIEVLEMTPLERPMPWAGECAQTFEFINPIREARRKRRIQDTRLRPIHGQWKLTDEEWSVAEKIIFLRNPVPSRGQSSDRRRDAVDGLVMKLGTGTPWAQIIKLSSGYLGSKKIHEQTKGDGRLEKLIEFLIASRSTVSQDHPKV
jgi:hypothetical protein